MDRPAALSLADFASAGVRLRPTDAVTIVRTLVLQVADRHLPGVPSAHVIRLLPSGEVTVEGPVVASGQPVPRAAQLLAALLPAAKPRSPEPSSLWRLIDRALQQPSAYATLEELATALAPFAAHDPRAALQGLVARWAAVSEDDEPAPDATTPVATASPSDVADIMSLSRMRRTRRDTGLSLDEVSKRSRIPVSLLRQLEWGYLRNWPQGLYGRTQLVRYARAAGLDRQRVLDAVWPLIEAQAGEPARSPLPASQTDASIVIVQSNFLPDEVLFEAEGTPTSAEVEAQSDGAPAPVELDADHFLQTAATLGLNDPASRADAPRRSSMIAAAAVLTLATAGALWGLRVSPADGTRATAQVVRHLPAKGDKGDLAGGPVPSAPVRGPHAVSPASLREGTGVSRAVSTTGVRPVADMRTIAALGRVVPADASDDDTLSSSAAFASAGGVAFADPIQPAPEGSGGGLGLRIMRVVDDHARNYHTRPSPDGARVAFDSDRDGDRAVFVADANGRNLRRVSGDGFAAMPSWSPDGRTLSYVRSEVDNPNVWNLWALNLDSGESRRLTSHPAGRPQGGSWFPDGQRIAYSLGAAVVVLDVASGKPATYPSPQPGRTAGTPAVSPDGRWVIFQVSGDGAWLLDLTDGGARKVLSDPTAGDFTWSPDGSRVAYYSRREAEWNVWVTLAR